MADIALTKSETTILTDAADRGGALVLPSTMKPVSAERLLGKLRKHALIVEAEGAEPRLTPGAYELLGIEPPKPSRAPGKNDLLLELIGRANGASLPELTAATGWLPHTARAAICRLRKSGQAIALAPRQDGSSAYRIAAPEKPVRKGRRKALAA